MDLFFYCETVRDVKSKADAFSSSVMDQNDSYCVILESDFEEKIKYV